MRAGYGPQQEVNKGTELNRSAERHHQGAVLTEQLPQRHAVGATVNCGHLETKNIKQLMESLYSFAHQ